MRLQFLCIALAIAPLAAQTNLGSVEGKVVNSVTGEGVHKAVVTIRSTMGQNSYFTATDQSGKFHIDNVQPAKYFASADAEGYAIGRSIATGKSFNVDAGQALTGVEVPVFPLSVISGKVLDEDGEPLDNVIVSALHAVWTGGLKTWQAVSGTQTDDRGQYRMFDLQPGRYYLVVSAMSRERQFISSSPNVHSSVPEEGYASVFYPGVADLSQASSHELKPGEEWAGADFKLHQQPLYHIRGHIAGGASGMRPNVQASSCDPAMPGGFGGFSSGMRANGAFDIAAVPGSYCLIVREPGRGGIAMRQPVTVKESIDGITLAPPASFTVKGSVVIDGTPPAGAANYYIALRSPDNNAQQRGQVGSDLTFQIENIFPGKYLVSLANSYPLYAKSMTYAGQDVSSGVIPDVEPGGLLSIIFGTDPGTVSGTVQLGALESGAPVSVVVLPDEEHSARGDMFRIVQSAAESTFTIQGLAPGSYKVYALELSDNQDAQNHDLLKLLDGQAAAITVEANGQQQISVTPISGSDLARAKEKLQ